MRICSRVLLFCLLRGRRKCGAQSLSGTAFDDRDGEGRQDRGESGIADVVLSNGRVLVSTDAHGCCRLPVSPGQRVFAIKPAGWRLLGNDTARPGARASA